MSIKTKVDFDTFAFNIGVQAGQTREASKPLHDAYTKATPEQQADLRTRWITKHLEGQKLNAGRILRKPRTERTAERAQRMGMTEEAFAKQMGDENAIRRMVTADEVAWVVAFLCSPKAVSITGEQVTVSGGWGTAIQY